MLAVDGERDDVPGIDGRLHLGSACGLNPHDLDARARQLDRRRDAGDEAASAYGHDNRRDIRALIEDLEARRGLPRDDPFVIERRHHRQASFRSLRFGSFPAMSRGGAGKDQFGPERARALDFDRWRRRWHHDDSGRSQLSRCQRYRLPVVAGRVGDDAARALFRREPRDHVVGPADLEGAARLQALALEKERPAGGARRVDERSRPRNRPYAFGGLADVRERDQ